MADPAIDIDKLLESSEDVLGGEVVIRGTRVTVQSVAAAYLVHGIPLETLIEEDDRLSLSSLYAALAYYHHHKVEFEQRYEADVAWGEAMISAQERHGPGSTAAFLARR